ncbi:hypothetical protein [Dubosiella newyorkensis]|uniref:hypothetical protein n=1 Tax=Dubosiella newyorkensis TaxID=1862672 RepID=UPI0032B292B9
MKLQFEPFYQEYLDVLAAYDLASATMYTDQWTVAPKGGIPNSSAKMATLSKLAFKVENDPETREFYSLQKHKPLFLKMSHIISISFSSGYLFAFFSPLS